MQYNKALWHIQMKVLQNQLFHCPVKIPDISYQTSFFHSLSIMQKFYECKASLYSQKPTYNYARRSIFTFFTSNSSDISSSVGNT